MTNRGIGIAARHARERLTRAAAVFGAAISVIACAPETPTTEPVTQQAIGLVVSQQSKLLANDGAPNAALGITVAIDQDLVVTRPGYVFRRTGGVWTQEAKLPFPGNAVAVANNTAVVGNTSSNGTGAVRVFVGNVGTWTQQAVLVPTDAASGDQFGHAVAVFGDTIVASSALDDAKGLDSGSAYVFVRSGTTWNQQAKLVGDKSQAVMEFGASVAVQGDRAIVGARSYGTQNQGAVFIFARSGSTWVQEARLDSVVNNGSFGEAVAYDGDTVLALDGGCVGHVHVRSGTAWNKQADLMLGLGAGGACQAAVSADTAVIGNRYANVVGVNSGAASFFVRANGSWSLQSQVLPQDGASGDYFGAGVALSGSTVVVGAPLHDALGADSGAAYVFVVGGAACTTSAECGGGVCVDGICCDKPCSESCQVCTAAKGAPVDGVCATLPFGSPGSPQCAPYVCNGTSPACPGGCGKNADCSTGFCFDGVCCDKPCSGTCEACVQIKTGKPDGTCAPIPAGTDPDADCADDGAPSCAQNGFCDGAGACQKYPLSSGCTPQPCTIGSQCKSGFCTDGICCDASCTGPCRACTAAKKGKGLDGICEPIVADSDPDNECTQDVGYPANCGADGHCDGTGACRTLAKPGTACGASSCDGNTIKGQICNGLGLCTNDPQGQSCAPYICSANVCTNSCTQDAECDSTAYCTAAGTCAPRQANGSTCTRKEECTSTLCADGYCCNSPCVGQCEACDLATAKGSCVPVVGEPRGQRPKCPTGTSSAPCTAAICNGNTTTTCAGFVGNELTCRLAECDGSSLLPDARCDGAGACKLPPPVDCGAYQCAGGACKSTCASAADCAKGHDCQSGKCVSQATCDDDHTLSTPTGETKDCAPYRCTDPGVCLNSCASAADCVAGYSCSSTGSCVARDTPESADDSGCGCRVPRRGRHGSGAALLLALGLVALARRRRPERRRLRPAATSGLQS